MDSDTSAEIEQITKIASFILGLLLCIQIVVFPVVLNVLAQIHAQFVHKDIIYCQMVHVKLV